MQMFVGRSGGKRRLKDVTAGSPAELQQVACKGLVHTKVGHQTAFDGRERRFRPVDTAHRKQLARRAATLVQFRRKQP